MELRLIIMALVCLCIAQLAFATDEEQRLVNLTKQLRCAECMNQSVYDSNASLALAMRSKVAGLIQDGETDAEIRAYFTQRYGDYILFAPPLRVSTWLLWGGPLIMLIIAMVTVFKSYVR